AATMPDLAREAALWVTKLLLLLVRLPLDEAVAAARQLRLRREVLQPVLHVLTTWQGAAQTAGNPSASRLELVRAFAGWAPEGLLLLCLTGYEDQVLRYWRDLRHVRLAITGTDLLQAGVPAGPALGRALDRVLADCLDALAPDRETQLTLALRYVKEEA
ncbi:MAG TPA: hypothetical protein VK464_10985, partial [Symbiobacteriaceae bacterium]|nr:hypothetical protein [Symbiobacteriaceae bacterium]